MQQVDQQGDGQPVGRKDGEHLSDPEPGAGLLHPGRPGKGPLHPSL